MSKVILMLSILAFSTHSFAWGNRGHHTVCEAATYLVKDPGLRQFMTARSHMMGHLCNIPDIFWRGLGSDVTSLGNPTHYIDLEIIDLKISDVPLDYRALIKSYEGTDNKMKPGVKIKSFSTEFGSLWWRADQFYRRAVEAGVELKNEAPPKTSSEQQDQKLKYNQAGFRMLTSLGLMGHYVGDASMPYHTAYDYDGYSVGHGGVHVYYEDEGVDAQEPNLVSEVVQAGKKMQHLKKTMPKFLSAESVLQKMRELSIVSVRDIEAVVAIDPVMTLSKIEKRPGGKEVRTAALRKPISTVAQKFKPLITAEITRSAVLLAKIWDDAYEKMGKPDLSLYRSYQYPLLPEFVPPDYFDVVKPASAPAPVAK